MDSGSISKTMGVLSQVAIQSDLNPEAVRQARVDLMTLQGNVEWLTDARTLRRITDEHIGYVAGFLDPILGNKVLAIFKTTHPYFGNTIPDDIAVCYDLGKKLGQEYNKRVQAEQEALKRVQMTSELGVLLPTSECTVTNDDAARVLNALRSKRVHTANLV